MNVQKLLIAALVLGVFAIIQPAYAYMGPGSGLGVIGTLLAVIGAVIFAIIGFIWYPLKRLMKSRKSKQKQ